jgi:hypothetical protein
VSLPPLAALLPAIVALSLGLAGCGRAEPPAQTKAGAAPADQAWVEMTDRGPEARFVTSAAACPPVTFDGASTAMTVRSTPSADFPVTVCAAPLPKDVAHASIGPHVLPLPAKAINRIVIFGDTGCRLKGAEIQDCDDTAQWPFGKIARLAAAHKPDLVIHVGDYYYRESACPAGRAGCAGSPWGDNWTTWSADFFAPAAPLLEAAPWVLVRGNHEDCARGGPGWFALLDAAQSPLACPAVSAPIRVDVGGLQLYVLDSADTDDQRAPAGKVATFAAQLDALKQAPPTEPAWILTHRPIWGLVPVANAGPLGPLEVPLNATEQAAAKGRDLSGVSMIVSGHIHHFASFSFTGDRPAQLVAGTGGDVGDPGDTPKFLDGTVNLDGMMARRFGFERYGFLVMERAGDAWRGTFYDVGDKAIATCSLVKRALTCGASGG